MMVPALVCKPGVIIGNPTPAGMRLLSALEHTCRALGRTLTITSGRDAHGANTPHGRGEAYDVRTKGFTHEQKVNLLLLTVNELRDDLDEVLVETSGGLASRKFFAFIEDLGKPNEHLHAQLRKGRVYP